MNDQDVERLGAVWQQIVEIVAAVSSGGPVEGVLLGQVDEVAEATLAQTAELTALREELDILLDKVTGQQVQQLRYLRVSWKKVSSALGMTGTSAYKKAKANSWVSEDPPP